MYNRLRKENIVVYSLVAVCRTPPLRGRQGNTWTMQLRDGG